MSRNGQRLALPADGQGEAMCPETGERYRLVGGRCQRVDEEAGPC